MPKVVLHWTIPAKTQFDALQKTAMAPSQRVRFVAAHNTIVEALENLESALEKGEAKFHTKRPGGIVRHWICDCISVVYVVFADERVGWVMKYNAVPSDWPGGEYFGTSNGQTKN